MNERRLSLSLFALTLLVALALGTWVRRGAVESGFWADDYAQQAMLDGTYPSSRPIWDLFHFVDDTPDDHQRVVGYGVYPWWSHPHFKLTLLRPLPSLTRALDHHLFGVDAKPQHIHSLLWWALLVAVVGLLLFLVLPPMAAAIALVLYSIDESQTVPVLWIANRSALMATAFMIASLVCHLRAVQSARAMGWHAASLTLFSVALGCGEYSLASTGYLIGMELLMPGRSIRARVRTLLPFAALAGLFLAIVAMMGYGSAHSALYTSPFSAPLDYLAKVVQGVPVIMADLVFGVPADWWSFGSPWPAQMKEALSLGPEVWEQLPSWRTVQIALGLLSMAIIVLLLQWIGRRTSRAHFRTLVWLIAGAFLGMLPVMGSFITTRLALPSEVGFAALYGLVVSAALGRPETDHDAPEISSASRRHSRWGAGGIWSGRILVVIIAWLHGYRAFCQSESSTFFYTYIAQSRTRWPLTAVLDEQRAPEQRLVMVAAADANDAPYLPFVRTAFGRPLLRGFRLLSGAPGAHAITRIDARTLDVHVTDDFGLSASVAGSFTRAAGEGLSPNDVVRVPGTYVTVLRVERGQPTHLRFRFDVPLESEALVFVHSTPQGLQRLILPQVGSSLQLPPPVMPNLALLAGP